MSNDNWNDDAIQFPRLIAEIVATQESLDMPALCDSMDLEPEQIFELFDRAQAEWEQIKQFNAYADHDEHGVPWSML